jgi:hypothetical protein
MRIENISGNTEGRIIGNIYWGGSNIKKDLRGTGREGESWLELAQERVR